jgi:hypothetical protein
MATNTTRELVWPPKLVGGKAPSAAGWTVANKVVPVSSWTRTSAMPTSSVKAPAVADNTEVEPGASRVNIT